MSTSVIIRPATPADEPALRGALVELQDYERALHATRQPGEPVADAYLERMLNRAKTNGIVLVAECDGGFVGFASGWVQTEDNIAETPDSNRFGYISDICIMPAFRGQRIAARLLEEIEQYLRRFGVGRLRINALATNSSARRSYEHSGFAPYEILYEKPVTGENGT